MTPTGTTQVAAVVGDPVRHSLSPVLHNAAFRASGLDWIFVALEVAAVDGSKIVEAMSTLGLSGLAVTTPHKAAVAATVHRVDPAAAALRSVNTVVRHSDGTTTGASTDGAGFLDSLRAAGHDPAGCRVAVLGAGAAARSVIDALGRADVECLGVINRTAASAHEAAALSDRAQVVDPAEASRTIVAADIIINATSIGLNSQDMALDPSSLRSHHVVADLVYHPLDTALLRAAREVGAATVDGLGMLVHQAARQQELWTGVRPDPSMMRSAAENELDRRRR